MYLWGKEPEADRKEFVVGAKHFASETSDLERIGWLFVTLG